MDTTKTPIKEKNMKNVVMLIKLIKGMQESEEKVWGIWRALVKTSLILFSTGINSPEKW